MCNMHLSVNLEFECQRYKRSFEDSYYLVHLVANISLSIKFFNVFCLAFICLFFSSSIQFLGNVFISTFIYALIVSPHYISTLGLT